MITDVVHSTPRVVSLKNVEDELSALPLQSGAPNTPPSASLRARTLTLVMLCDRNEEPQELESLVAEIVSSNPARVILIAQHDPDADAWLETRVSLYHQGTGAAQRLVGEEIEFYPRGAQYESLPSAVLALRVSGLPFVLYWRGQPDLQDPLFHSLVGESDEVLFDSQHFTARAERINETIARMRSEYPEVAFGDINWQRIRAWREIVAQFFDDPANVTFLDTITHVTIEFSVGFNGNQSAAVLMMGWLVSSLGWSVVHGSYKRDGLSRSARFERHPYSEESVREILVEIQVREQTDCLPGELTGVRMETGGDLPIAVFQAKRAVGGFVDVQELTPTRYSERCQILNIPHESNVIASELDAPRRDRNYHRALALLDSLVAPIF